MTADAPLVDCHFHLFDKSIPFVDKPRHTPDYDFTAEEVLTTFDRHGVRYGVIAGASLYGSYHDHVIRAVRKHKRLRATVVADPSLDLYTMEKMAADGIVGVRLVWISLSDDRLPDITSSAWRQLLHRVRDLDWHVHLHVGRGRLPAILPTILPTIQASGAKTVLDHFGYPDPALGLKCPEFQTVLRALDNGRTWVKLSAGYRMNNAVQPYATKLLAVAGPERLVWGSDAPFASFEGKVTYQQTLDDLASWVPDPAARHIIGTETPLKLYFS
jgi:predicted TIM-barrel fold metal-dependent hydrolase